MICGCRKNQNQNLSRYFGRIIDNFEYLNAYSRNDLANFMPQYLIFPYQFELGFMGFRISPDIDISVPLASSPGWAGVIPDRYQNRLSYPDPPWSDLWMF